MTPKFSVGETVIFYYTDVPKHQYLMGEECEILEIVKHDYFVKQGYDFYYLLSITDSDGSKLACVEKCLKKKSPPPEEEEIDWMEKLNLNNIKQLEKV